MNEEQVRFKVGADSELPLVISQLDKLIQAQTDLGNQGDKMSKKMQDAYRTQSLAIRDLTGTIQDNYKEINTNADTHAGKVKGLGKEYNAWEGAVKTIRNQLIMAFGVSEIKGMIEKVFELTSVWQKYNAALGVALGSQDKATIALDMLQNYADVTNFSLGELADTFTKFANRGVVLGRENMERLGDVANALQKPFKDLGEAILDVNNTERWNELGIKAKTNGDKVALTFKGVTLEVDRTEQAVMLAVSAFGTMNGVAGQTAAQAKTLDGRFSTLKDGIAGAARTLGKEMTPAFEGAIDAASSLVKVVGGSESAFTRTINYAKAIGTAWVAYQVAANAAIIKTTVLSAALAAKEAIMKGAQIATGTYQLVMASLTTTTTATATATTAAATAARGFWAAIASNPIGLLVTAIGTLVTSYYAYKAVTTEVTSALGEQELKLRVQQKELGIVGELALKAAEGTNERKRAIDRLIKDYPDYFKGVDREKLSNVELKAILDKVNTSYSKRIELARESYKVEQLAEKQKSLFQQEAELMDRLAKKMPELAIKAGGSVTELMKLVDGMSQADKFKFSNVQGFGEWFSSITNGRIAELAPKIAKGLQEVEKQYLEHTGKINKIQEESLPLAVKLENQRWAKVAAKLEQGSTEYTKAFHDHEVKLLKAKGEYIELGGNQENKANKDKKERAIFSAKELAVITKQVQQEYFKDQLALVDAQKELDIERVNHSKLTEAQAQQAIVKIVDEAEAKKTAMRRKFMEYSAETYKEETLSSKDLKEAQVFDMKEAEKAKKDTEKAKRDESKKTVEEWTAHQKDVQRITKETAKIETDSREDVLKMAFDHLSAQEGIFGQLSKIARTVYEDINLINGKTVDGYVKSTMAAKAFAEEQARIHGVNSEEYKKAQLGYLEENKKLEEVKANALKQKMAIATMVLDLLETVKNGIVQSVIGANDAIIQSSIKIRDTMNELYDDILELNKSALEAQLDSNNDALAGELSAFKGTQAEKTRIIEDYYQRQTSLIESFYERQKTLAEAKDSINAQITFNTRMLEINTETTQKISSAWDLSKGPLGPQTLFKVLTAWKEHNAQLEAVAYQREAHEKQLAIQRVQFEIDKAGEIRDAKLEALKQEFEAYQQKINDEIDAAESAADDKIKLKNKELDAVREAYQKEVDIVRDAYNKQVDALRERQTVEENALRATYELKQQLLAQSSSDEIDQLSILDRVRNDALERYRTAEVNKLIATRNRILATLTNEDERAAVTAEYERKIEAVHSQVEEAKLEKTKGVSLATTQIRNEEKDESIKLKEEEKTVINKLQDDFQAKFKELADERDITLANMAEANKKREGELKDEIEKIQMELTNEIKRLKGLIDAQDAEMNNKMKAANSDYANAVNQANRDIFELTKQMKIAELKAEIAILRGKRNLFNRGKIDSAIDDLNGAIGDIQGLSFGSAPSSSGNNGGNTNPVTGGGNNGGDNGPDPNNPNPSDPNSPETKVEEFFRGTPYVRGVGYPDGIDTVPAMLTKGERILPVSLNEQLGPMVSNVYLVESYHKMEELRAKFGSVDPLTELRAKFGDIRIPELTLLNYNAGTTSYKSANVDLSGLEREVKKLVETIEAKPELNIHVDANQITVAEVGRNEQHVTYYENIYNR